MPRIHGATALTWWVGATPPTGVTLAANTYVGVRLQFTVPGRVAGFSVFRRANEEGHWYALMWAESTGLVVATKRFRQYSPSPLVDQWRNEWIRPWFRVDTTETYRMAVMINNDYQRHANALVAGVTVNGIRFLAGFQSTAAAPNLLAATINTNANAVDVLFQSD